VHMLKKAQLQNIIQHMKISISFIFLAAQPGKLVGHNNIKLGGSLHNLFPLPCGHIVGNLSTVGPEKARKHKNRHISIYCKIYNEHIVGAALTSPVVHHQQLKFLGVVHNKFLETIRKIMAGLLVCTITNVGHQCASLELSSYTRVDTLWPAPVCLP